MQNDSPTVGDRTKHISKHVSSSSRNSSWRFRCWTEYGRRRSLSTASVDIMPPATTTKDNDATSVRAPREQIYPERSGRQTGKNATRKRERRRRRTATRKTAANRQQRRRGKAHTGSTDAAAGRDRPGNVRRRNGTTVEDGDRGDTPAWMKTLSSGRTDLD